MTPFRIIFSLCFCMVFMACQNKDAQHTGHQQAVDTATAKQQISAMLDSFNVAAAHADYDRYFNFFTPDAVFLGTDATEHWSKDSFMVWSKPYFDRKKAWHFTALERMIYLGKYPDIAWFDELLDTGKGRIDRGSGVVVFENGQWKVQQYVLSMTIPNSVGAEVVKIKAAIEDSLMKHINRR